MSKRIVNRTLSAAIVAALYASASYAQEAPAPAPAKSATELETVVVTGSLIRGTPEDSALPVEVFTAEDLAKQGDPSPLEFAKSLTISGPTTGESYYFSGSNLNNDVRFNLRGLGADKTLTLFNGRRAFQNVAVLPNSVIERIEVLKDGAAVTYGADATGGVVNMITRRKFDGFEGAASYKTYSGTEQGEWKLSGIAGFNTDTANVLFSVEWDHRSELDTSERDFSSLPYGVNPAPASQLTNLAGWVPRAALPVTPTNTAVGEWGTALGLVHDFTQTSCEQVGGTFVPGVPVISAFNKCAYNYIPYYNLVEENDLYRVYAQVTADISDTTEFYFRALWARNYSPHQYGSPSQPVIRGPARATGATYQLYAPSTNPHVAAFAARTGWATNPLFAASRGYTPITYRAFAHGGNDTFASGDNHSTPNENETKYWHISTGFSGDMGEAFGFDVGATFNQSVSTNTAPDMMGFRVQEALNGFGGPNCSGVDLDPSRFGTQAVAAGGVDTGVRPAGCLWYNPFASNFSGQPTLGLANPSYIAGAQNSDELVNWLFNERESETSNYNLTLDAVFSGTTPLTLPGGDIGWGAGVQWRTTKNRETVNDPYYNGMTPCDWPGQNPAGILDPLFTGCTLDKAGPFLFFANNPPDATHQQQQSIFAEVSLPLLDSLNVSAAVRHEEFQPIGLDATVYKISAKWQVLDQFALRGSYGTNYQAPGAAIIPGDLNNGVASYTVASGAWLGSQTFTRSDIEPETATVWNVGAIAQFEFGSDHEIQIILDYFDIETENELGLVATSNDIATSVFSLPGATALLPRLADCSHPLISRVTLNSPCVQGTTNASSGPNGFASVRTDFGNGPGQHTSGIDLQANYGFGLGTGRLQLGATVTYVAEFEFDAYVLDGYVVKPIDNRVGYLNFATVGNAAPEWKGNFSVNYSFSDHNVRAVINYVSGVKDERFIQDDNTVRLTGSTGITPEGYQPGTTTPFAPSYYGVIGDKWLSGDLHYQWRSKWATLSASVLNVTDEDPPASRQEFGYDPRIGNPLGRVFEVGIKKEF